MTEQTSSERFRAMYPNAPVNLTERLAATYDRISQQVEANVREEKERREALAWCRANGNPHRARLAAIEQVERAN